MSIDGGFWVLVLGDGADMSSRKSLRPRVLRPISIRAQAYANSRKGPSFVSMLLIASAPAPCVGSRFP